MIIALYIAAAVIMAVGSLYFAWQNMDFRKFLAGAFFVSSGILFYLYLADVAVPLLGTSFVASPSHLGPNPLRPIAITKMCEYSKSLTELHSKTGGGSRTGSYDR